MLTICRTAAAVLGLAAALHATASAQGGGGFVPVGAEYRPADLSDARRRDLEEMQRLGFNVVVLVPSADPAASGRMMFLERMLAGAPDARVMLPLEPAPASIALADGTSAARVTVDCWAALARGARGVVFRDWTTLVRNAEALVAASAFAEEMTRNAALYAPLRPSAAPPGQRRIHVDPATGLDARFLESPEALVLIAINRRRAPQAATLTFSPDVPEAIWQNMSGSGDVNFVAGPDGPLYERTFAPHEVLVLMIRKAWR